MDDRSCEKDHGQSMTHTLGTRMASEQGDSGTFHTSLADKPNEQEEVNIPAAAPPPPIATQAEWWYTPRRALLYLALEFKGEAKNYARYCGKA